VASADVQIGQGKVLQIRTEGNAPDRWKVAAIEWNGQPLDDHRIHADQLLQGGTLLFKFATGA
jgi:putative alpha-1,2-mannosidase